MMARTPWVWYWKMRNPSGNPCFISHLTILTPHQEKLLLTQQPAKLNTLVFWCSSRNHFGARNIRLSFRGCKVHWLHQPKITHTHMELWILEFKGKKGGRIQFGIVFLSEGKTGLHVVTRAANSQSQDDWKRLSETTNYRKGSDFPVAWIRSDKRRQCFLFE